MFFAIPGFMVSYAKGKNEPYYKLRCLFICNQIVYCDCILWTVEIFTDDVGTSVTAIKTNI